jgi:thiamine biosynthesis lipoprotein
MSGIMYKVRTEYLFNSHIKIKIPDNFENNVFDELFEIMEKVDKKYNSYSEFSYFDLINKNSGTYVKVDKTTIEILETTRKYSDFFGGSYDITIMPLIRLWGFYKKNRNTVPSYHELKKAKKKVDYKKLETDSEKLTVKSDKSQEIITGSFIKSFAVDAAVLRLQELGIDNAVINAGGSSIAGINNNIKKEWEISVSDPDNSNLDLFDLKIRNMSYSTSAQGDSFVKINNRKYGHIINPDTGQPSENKMAGIITAKSFIGDILSTGLFNCEPERFLQLMKILRKEMYAEGFLMDKNRNLYYSEGFQKHVHKSRI